MPKYFGDIAKTAKGETAAKLNLLSMPSQPRCSVFAQRLVGLPLPLLPRPVFYFVFVGGPCPASRLCFRRGVRVARMKVRRQRTNAPPPPPPRPLIREPFPRPQIPSLYEPAVQC